MKATIALLSASLVGCAARSGEAPVSSAARPDRPDRVLERATAAQIGRFNDGDALFEVTYRAPDGLGPLFIRSSCAACHKDDGRGPGVVGKFASANPMPYGNTLRPYVTGESATALGAELYADAAVTYRMPPPVF